MANLDNNNKTIFQLNHILKEIAIMIGGSLFIDMSNLEVEIADHLVRNGFLTYDSEMGIYSSK